MYVYFPFFFNISILVGRKNFNSGFSGTGRSKTYLLTGSGMKLSNYNHTEKDVQLIVGEEKKLRIEIDNHFYIFS